MADSEIIFEVEIRCHFENTEEALSLLPFLGPCLQGQDRVSWTTRFYGMVLFKSGALLRQAEVFQNGKTRHYLGWKGPDSGHFANIRQEIDEECTNGIASSAILERLGGNKRLPTRAAVIRELVRLGHSEFMSFHGNDLSGYDETLNVKVKLMNCPVLKWPILVELEKTANTEEEAVLCENYLRELSIRFQLQTRLVREEPPSLLHAQLSSRQSMLD